MPAVIHSEINKLIEIINSFRWRNNAKNIYFCGGLPEAGILSLAK